ncbi:hypothetical protein ACROYT_G017517 [Oculina patagonica]
MYKVSFPALVFMCLAISVLFICSQDVEGAASPPRYGLWGGKREEMARSRRTICEAARSLKCERKDADHQRREMETAETD